MPSSSAKQSAFMRAVAHSPEFAKKVDVPQGVGREFVNADKSAKRKALVEGLKRKTHSGPSPYLQRATGGVRG